MLFRSATIVEYAARRIREHVITVQRTGDFRDWAGLRLRLDRLDEVLRAWVRAKAELPETTRDNLHQQARAFNDAVSASLNPEDNIQRIRRDRATT